MLELVTSTTKKGLAAIAGYCISNDVSERGLRQHAMRMAHALRRYVAEHGYDRIGILVAFSGTVTDEGVEYTGRA